MSELEAATARLVRAIESLARQSRPTYLGRSARRLSGSAPKLTPASTGRISLRMVESQSRKGSKA